MGGSESRIESPDPLQQIVPPRERLCLTEERFVFDEAVQLHFIKQGLQGYELKVVNGATGEVYFQFEQDRNELLACVTLQDVKNGGRAILRLKKMFRSEVHRFKIYSGRDFKNEICIVNTPHSTSGNDGRRIAVVFNDASMWCQRTVVLEGDWKQRNCFLYVGEPKLGRVPVAKISQKYFSLTEGTDNLEKDYVLEVAPGVDIALVATMCVAMKILN